MISELLRHRHPYPLLLSLMGILLLDSVNSPSLKAQTIDIQPLAPIQSLEWKLPTSGVAPKPVSPLVPVPQPAEALPTTIPDTITVERFEFVGNTVFSPEELATVTQSFTKRPISFVELLQARAAVTKLYVERGYVTSGAYIPPQALENGTVMIKIIEGSLEAINVHVKGKLDPNYVRDRLKLGSGTPLNVHSLLQSLQMLQLNPLIEKVSADLSAGDRPGSNILDVTVETARSFYPQVILDNGRNPQVGSFRRGVDIADNNFVGFGDSLRGVYLNTDGSNDYDFSYTFPLNPRNGTLKLEYRTIESKIIEPPFDRLNISSNYQSYLLSFRQPIIETPNQELALGVSFNRQESATTFLGGIPFPGSSADAQGQTRVSTVRFFQEWVQRSKQQVLAARSEFSLGIDALGITTPFDAAINADAPSSTYFTWRGQAQWVSILAPDTLLLARGDMQVADRPVVSLEQFALGGLGSVEGYRQNTLLTDNGLFASVELRLPIFRAPKEEILVQIIPFIDFGTGWNSGKVPDPTINTLASLGIGLQWQQGKHFSARLDWANRLGKVPYIEGNSLQDKGFFFTVNFGF